LGLVLLECEIGESPWADITSMIDLVMTIEDESIEEYIPDTTEEGMRELLLACLQKEQGKCSAKLSFCALKVNVSFHVPYKIITQKNEFPQVFCYSLRGLKATVFMTYRMQ
jgi:hypothetical protein